jgi:hypothetical protein
MQSISVFGFQASVGTAKNVPGHFRESRREFFMLCPVCWPDKIHIKHSNIVSGFKGDIFTARNGACGFFTMEPVPGGRLAKFWRSHGMKIRNSPRLTVVFRQPNGLRFLR